MGGTTDLLHLASVSAGWQSGTKGKQGTHRVISIMRYRLRRNITLLCIWIFSVGLITCLKLITEHIFVDVGPDWLISSLCVGLGVVTMLWLMNKYSR